MPETGVEEVELQTSSKVYRGITQSSPTSRDALFTKKRKNLNRVRSRLLFLPLSLLAVRFSLGVKCILEEYNPCRCVLFPIFKYGPLDSSHPRVELSCRVASIPI